MNKLPVFRTFGRAVGFTFWNFFTIFRLSWLPFTLLIAANILIGVYAQTVILGNEPLLDPFSISAHIDEILFLNVIVWILEAIAVAAVAVSIHRVILFADRKPGEWLNFPFGTTEFLYVLMGVVTALIIITIIAVAVAPAVYLVSGGDVTGFFAKIEEAMKDWPRSVRDEGSAAFVSLIPILVAYVAGWVVAIYFLLRLAVWPPAIVATRSFALGETWSLTHGNVLRFIGLFVLVIFTFYLLLAVPAGAAYWYYATKLKAAPPTEQTQIVETMAIVEPKVEVEDPEKAREMIREEMRRSMSELQPWAFAFWLVQLLVYVFATGLGVALLSYSYKALKGYAAHEPIPDDG